ncbi:MAG: PAS domain-containing protein [Methanoregula sp.]|jgi:PAS domain S-box-containing protein|nr:PAS domain-containing protein [Methanoregula sp.]
MNLRTKLLLGIGIALIVTFAFVAVFSLITMDESYCMLEEREVITTVQRAQSSLSTDQKSLQSTTRDWAAWMDTYRFAQGENPGWIDANIDNDFFERFDVQGVIAFNRSGDRILAEGYNPSFREAEDIPKIEIEQIRTFSTSSDIINSSKGSYVILKSSSGPLIVSSHPILMDTYEGPGEGSFHIIRRADERYLAGLSARTGSTVTIISSMEISGNQTLTGIIAGITPEKPVVVVAENPDTITGYAYMDDLGEAGQYYIRVSGPRTIHQTGEATMVTFILSLAVAGVFLITFVLLFIDRVVLSRLNNMIRTMRTRTDTDGTKDTPDDSGVDELARLAHEIDPVFERLAESQVQLQQSEERYRSLAESAQDFIYIIDTKDRVTYVNSFAAAAVQKSPAEIIGKPRSALFPATEGERQRGNIRKVIETGQTVKIESNLPLPSGELWSDTILVPLRDRNNAISGVLGVSRDITQRKRAEEALYQANKKLNLLSSITRHDILNQLTALRTYLELSLDYTTDQAMIDFIAKEKVISEIIDQQISFTRDYQKMGLKLPAWQDVDAVVSWVILPLAKPAVKVTIDCPGLEVFADPMLEKVFYNLVDNALRYGGKSMSEVHISARDTPTGLVIMIEDNGGGVPDENKDRIFERGFGQNTGFGLFLSREILEITNITIQETGTFGRGARFEIRVPKGAYRFSSAGQKE